MASGRSFVEWKEQFVSKERGNRVVHYYLKDVSGESILAVVGNERSVRHMFYVVSDDYLNVLGPEKTVHAGFRWRSRREVVNWLTSMLSKQHRQTGRSKSPKNNPIETGVSAQQTSVSVCKSRLARNMEGRTPAIAWSGDAWGCGKQLKHYPSFRRNGITILAHSFVSVMAEEDKHHLAYLEDMYEDRKAQKKVKVRWFHRSQEVENVVSLRNPHPKEVFITPYAQVISAECVDGPAIVLTREHYEQSLEVLPSALLARVHICCRQFKSNRVKPFKLTKLRGYFDQQIFSCFSPDFFEDCEFSPLDNVKVGAKRKRSSRANQDSTCKPSYENVNGNLSNKRMIYHKHDELLHSWPLHANEKIELLSQDSGLRGCWFRCTVLQVSRKQLKVKYDDLNDEIKCGNLEEWVPSFRVARPDKLGIRCAGRLTIRPARPLHDQVEHNFKVGAAVDAWWCEGWWEGVVTGIAADGGFQVYVPSENLLLKASKNNLRVSRDYIGDKWVDIEANSDILSVISAIIRLDTKMSPSTMTAKETQSSYLPISGHEAPSSKATEEKRVMDCEKNEKQVSMEDRDVKSNDYISQENEGSANHHSNDSSESLNGADKDDTQDNGSDSDSDDAPKSEEFETGEKNGEAELPDAE